MEAFDEVPHQRNSINMSSGITYFDEEYNREKNVQKPSQYIPTRLLGYDPQRTGRSRGNRPEIILENSEETDQQTCYKMYTEIEFVLRSFIYIGKRQWETRISVNYGR